eukprot:2704727-Amphidinium_carterae.1
MDELLADEMDNAENSTEELRIEDMTPDTAKRTRSLAYMFTMLCGAVALTKLQNNAVCSNNGFEVWRKFVIEWAPRMKGRHRAMLQTII